jgi:hypothetical protein
MDVFGSIKTCCDILDSLYKKFAELRQADGQRVQQIYIGSIEPSFQQLTKIHDDYTANLSKLRDHLRDHLLPPRDLLLWVRDAGLKYRSARENLWTIDADLRSTETPDFGEVKKRHGRFMAAYRRYIRSIIEYYRCTVSWYGLSMYRSSEHTLQSVLDSVGDDEASDGEAYMQFKQFYEHVIVTDLTQELTIICDVRLPQHWQAVCRTFREVRMYAGDAASSQQSD